MNHIYKIINNVNKKIYIGKTSNPNNRWITHKSRAKSGQDHSPKLYRAMRKYGIDNFTFEVLEKNVIDSSAREKFWILFYNSINTGYNITEGGDGIDSSTMKKIWENPDYRERARLNNLGSKNPRFGKKNSDEQRINHSKLMKENNPFKNKNHTQETKQLMSKNHADFKGKNHPLYGTHKTEKQVEYLSIINEINEYKFIDKSGNVFLVNNLRQFSKEYNLKVHSLYSLVYGKQLKYKGWIGYIIGKEYLRSHFDNIIDIIKYKLFDSYNNEYLISNLKMFCIEHNLNYHSMNKVVNCKYKQHKGWTGYKMVY